MRKAFPSKNEMGEWIEFVERHMVGEFLFANHHNELLLHQTLIVQG